MSSTSNGSRLSIAAVVSAVMLAGTLTPASATPQEGPIEESAATLEPQDERETSVPEEDEESDDAEAEEEEEAEAESTPATSSTTTEEPPSQPAVIEDPSDELEQEQSQQPHATTLPQPSSTAPESASLLHEDFSDDGLPAGWEPILGDWRVEDGRLLGTSTGEQARIVFGEHHDNYRFEATMRFDESANDKRWTALGLDMPTDDSENWQQAAMRVASSASNGLEFAQQVNGGWNVTDVASAHRDVGIGEDVTIAIEVSGNRAAWYFEDELMMETNQLRRSSDGVFGLVVNNATVAFDEVKITEIEPFPVIDMRNPGEPAAIVAHRGDSMVAPENTMAAVTSAVEGGADYFEVDINFTEDDEVVAIHDSTLDRTTDGSGTVRDMTYDEIAELDAGSWFDPAYAYADVPKLEEVFDYMRDSGAHVLLEYKDDWTPAQVDLTTELVEQYDVADQIIAQSFDHDTVESLQEVLPEVPRMILGAPQENAEEIADDLGAIGWNPNVNQVLENPAWVERMHEANLHTFVYTVNDADQWEQLTELGVDGIITDHPGQLNGWNQRYVSDAPLEGNAAKIVGHRGNSAVAPENTMPAIASSVHTGAEYFEIDIEYTADDVVVAVHDSSVDRTTDGTGNVRDLTYDEIRELDAGSWFAHEHGYAGVGVPTLEEVLAYMQESDAHMLLEYKSTWSEEKVALTQELIEKYGVADQIIAQSFDLTTVESLQQELPEVPRMILGGPRDDAEVIAENLGAVGWNPSVGQVLDTPGWVDRMHNAGLSTNVYTVNSASQWSELTALGVDGIITDYPDHLRGWNARLEQLGAKPAPEPSEPEPSEEPSEPQPTESEPAGPEPSEPAPTEPEPTEPDPTGPEQTEPEPTETGTAAPEPTQPATTPPAEQDTDSDDGKVVGTVILSPAEVLPGGTLTVEANGFDAGENVDITLNPTLATVQASPEGSFTTEITIPEDVEPGEHQITVTGANSGNTGSATLTVLDPNADEQPTTTSNQSTGDVELAQTGSTTGMIAMAALLMLLLGTILVIAHRRQARTNG